jgi:DNA-binding PadR family transcriptional regulator
MPDASDLVPKTTAPQPDPATLLPLAPREFLILLALAKGRCHGYGLIQESERLSDGRVAMDPANLYRTLKRLGRDGLVSDAGKAPSEEAGGERRRYYEITPLGRSVVAAEAERLARLAEVARERALIAPRAR